MQVALVYPDQPMWPKFDWVRRAFLLLGHEAYQVASLDALVDADAEADLVLFRHKDAGLNHADVIPLSRHRQAVWVQWWFDLVAMKPGVPLSAQPCLWQQDGLRTSPTGWLQLMQCMDLVLVKERGLLDDFGKIGVNAKWLDQGCPSTIEPCGHLESPSWDVLFYGSQYDTGLRRADVAALVSAGLSVAWAGSPGGASPPGCLLLPFCPADELPRLATNAAVTLSVDHRNDLDGYWSDRLWLALGMGAYVVHRRSLGLPDEIKPYISQYETTDELVAVVRELCLDRDRREMVGAAASRWVMANHTYRNRCQELLEMTRCLTSANAASAVALEK